MKKEKSQIGINKGIALTRGQVQKVYTVANIPCINSFDIKLEYYIVVHKSFENY